MSGGRAPTPPDPQQTAGAQTGANIQTAIANQYMNSGNQSGPGYETTRSQTGTRSITGPDGQQYDVPIMSQNTSLTGRNREIYDQANNATLRSASAANTQAERVQNQGALNFNGISRGGNANTIGIGQQNMVSNAPRLNGNVAQGDITQSYAGDFGEQRDEVQAALMERMNPSLQQDKGALEARLASQGIGIGSAAYESAMGDYGRQTNDARLTAILGAGQEQSRLVGMQRDQATFQNNAQGQQFGQDLQQVGLQNAARQGMFDNQMAQVGANNQARTQQQSNNLRQAGYADSTRARDINERMTQRDDPMRRLQALAGLGQAQQAPNVGMSRGQVANTDVAGLINDNYSSQVSNYNTQQANNQALWGGILGAGASIFSDERVKENIERVGKTDDGQNIYRYSYKGSPSIHLGLMAQEVEKKRPEAVSSQGGIKMVDYGKAIKMGGRNK